jgi:hypothetical protein
MIEATLQVCPELNRIRLHASALFCLGRFVTALFDGPTELRDLLLHSVELRTCWQPDNSERAIVAEYEVFDRANVSSQFAPVVRQCSKARHAFCEVDGTSHRGQQSPRGVITIPLRWIDGGIATIERDNAVR